MNTGQSLLSLGAMTLVALIVLQVNTGFVMTSSTLLDNKLNILAVSLASSIIEEASGKAFDGNTVVDAASATSDLTYPGSLGPGAGETYPNFNDFDDYNGFSITNNNLSSAEFVIMSRVNYINSSNPDQNVSVPTWHKKITVFVTSPSMLNVDGSQDTIMMSSVFSYWHFR
jgi:MSHA pilin protein MshD